MDNAGRKEDEQQRQQTEIAASFKAFLLTDSTKSNLNLYDHLTRVLMKVMHERPQNAVDVFEDLSLDVKRGLFEDNQSTLRDLAEPTAAELLAEQQRKLFCCSEEASQEEELTDNTLPNINEISYYLEQASVGLGREEMHRIFLALKQLVESQALQRCRLWGKILGREKNYVIAEAECREGDDEEVVDSTEEGPREEENKETPENETDTLPQSTYKPPPVVPKEALGTGTNNCAYYVCNEPGLPWVKLPTVSPAQITAARQIRKFFTGRLNAPVISYPPFPGNESNYLRAQIARISAGTQVGPQGFYVQDEGSEEDEAPNYVYEVNPDFEGIQVSEMAESLSVWVHHTQPILQQGRCNWVNLAMKPDEGNEDAEDEVWEEEPEEAEPEVGPPPLTPLFKDAEILNTPPWTLKLTSKLIPQHAIAVVRSNVWPGACAYSCGKKFENIYIGWGLKHEGAGYSPSVPPRPQAENPDGPQLVEALDPTLEDEQAVQEDQTVQEELENIEEEEEEDEEEED